MSSITNIPSTSYQSVYFFIKYVLSVLLIVLLLLPSCNEKESLITNCKISLSVNSEEFYEGCTIPISVELAGNTNADSKVKLIIENQEIGMIPSSPYKYYWNTKDLPIGNYNIKAIFISNDNISITDEKTINILAINQDCPNYVSDYDGNIYPAVQIGNQCWMQKNLITTHYSDGVALLNGIDSLVGTLENEIPGWYFAYHNDTNISNEYGYLYTWTTAMKGNKAFSEGSPPIQGICPEGWYIPSENEWKSLIDFVGGNEIAANKLKDNSSEYWKNNLNSTDNSSLFTALPGGSRTSFGNDYGYETEAYFWSSTETIRNHAYHLYLKSGDSLAFVLGHQDSKRFGYSIRCLKD